MNFARRMPVPGWTLSLMLLLSLLLPLSATLDSNTGPAADQASHSTTVEADVTLVASRSTAVDIALNQVGDPYGWGDEGSGSFDCSGLVHYAFNQAGIDIPRVNARTLATMGSHVDRDDLRRGDVVIFYGGDHAGIYIGDGQVVHASRSASKVKVASMQYMNYYTARRIG